MPVASPEELAIVAAELQKAWGAYTADVFVPPDAVEQSKSRLALIVADLWRAGLTVGLGEAALKEYLTQYSGSK